MKDSLIPILEFIKHIGFMNVVYGMIVASLLALILAICKGNKAGAEMTLFGAFCGTLFYGCEVGTNHFMSIGYEHVAAVLCFAGSGFCLAAGLGLISAFFVPKHAPQTV